MDVFVLYVFFCGVLIHEDNQAPGGRGVCVFLKDRAPMMFPWGLCNPSSHPLPDGGGVPSAVGKQVYLKVSQAWGGVTFSLEVQVFVGFLTLKLFPLGVSYNLMVRLRPPPPS